MPRNVNKFLLLFLLNSSLTMAQHIQANRRLLLASVGYI